MAKGLAKDILDSQAKVQSVGSEPSGFVHLLAIQVLKEIGIDISAQSQWKNDFKQ